MSKILAIGKPPESDSLDQAADILRQGGLVVYPTETYYGIAADHTNLEALDRLAEIKGRPQGKPIALILAWAGEAELLSTEVPSLARELMARHWPGPLTLILQARLGIHLPLLSKDGGLGMRLSPHPIAHGLAASLGRAITATSANLSGRPPVVNCRDLDPELLAGVDLVLDGGECPGGEGSTVLDVRPEKPRVIRQGQILLTI